MRKCRLNSSVKQQVELFHLSHAKPKFGLYDLSAPTRWQCVNVIVAVDDDGRRALKGCMVSEDVNCLMLDDSVEPEGVYINNNYVQ